MERFFFQIFSRTLAFLISFFRPAELFFNIRHLFRPTFILGTIAIPLAVQAQTSLFGLTRQGQYGGSLFTTDSDGRNLENRYFFGGDLAPLTPQNGLIRTSGGKIYGMTVDGGRYSYGTIFEFNPVTKSVLPRYNFGITTSDGINVTIGPLAEASNGKLYGMTYLGGLYGAGTIFQFDLATNYYLKVWDFNPADSVQGKPQGGFLYASANGMLYGISPQGTSPYGGCLFEFDPVNITMTRIKKFIYSPAASTVGSYELIQAADGLIYGTSRNLSTTSRIVFSLDPVSGIFTPKTTLLGASFLNTQSFVQANDGKLYSMISTSLRMVKYDPITNILTPGYTFSGSSNGSSPKAQMMLADNGKLYGTFNNGGANLVGTLFEYDPATDIFTKKIDFDYSIGANPLGRLLQGDPGKLYGTTSQGGDENGYGAGTLFEYDYINDVYKNIYVFSTGQGQLPQGSLLLASDNLFYGITYTGGDNYNGTIFSYNPGNNQVTQKYSFDGDNGCYPTGSLIQALDGKLYGMATFCGEKDFGTIYSYDPVNNLATAIIHLDSINGSFPYGSLFQAPDGLLYGMTSQGGTYNGGVIFSYNITTNLITKIKDFNRTITGGSPYGSLALGADNKLYGMTRIGGSYNKGTIFSLDPAGNTFTKLYDLSTITGGNPYGRLTLANGLFYGLTSTNNVQFNSFSGTLFSFDPLSNNLTVNVNFSASTGYFPRGSLMQASNGKLYGMCSSGGSNSSGTIFEYNPLSNVFTVTSNFDGLTGGQEPLYSDLTEACIQAINIQTQPKYINTCIGANIQIPVSADWVDTYQWYKDGTMISGAIGPVLTVTNVPLKSTYYCRLSNGCSTITSLVTTVIGNVPPMVNAGPSQLACVNQLLQLSGTSTILGTVSTYYYWSNGMYAKDVSFPVTTTGIITYSFVGSDFYGCTSVDTLTVNVRALPLPSINGGLGKYICKGELTSFSGSGAVTYSWSGGISNNTPFTKTVAGIYVFTLTGTDANSCSSNALITLTVDGPSLTISGINAICVGTSTFVSVSGANSFKWDNGSINSSLILYPQSTTSYMVTGTGFNGCINETDVASITVTVDGPPVLSVSGKNVICRGELLNLTLSGAVSYIWPGTLTGPVFNDYVENSIVFPVTATGPIGCNGVSMINVTVTNNVSPVITISDTDPICPGTSASLTASGANTYRWEIDDSTDAVISVAPMFTTTYRVTGTGTNGCSTTVGTTIKVNTVPNIQASGSNLSTCACIPLSISIAASGVGLLSYQWYKNDKPLSDGHTTNYDIISVTTSGDNYKCVVTNSCGNSSTSTGVNVNIECSIPPVSQWIQLKCKLICPGSLNGAQQGIGVAVSGDGKIGVIGGYQDNANQGAAWVYSFNGVDFIQLGEKIIGTGNIGPARQGRSVNLSGDGKTMIMGGLDDNNQVGAAWIYTFNGTSFVQFGEKLVGTGVLGGISNQGASVALSGNGKIAVVGGLSDNNYIGAAWVYTFNGSSFVQAAKLVGDASIGTLIYQGYGVDISSDGKTIAIGGLLDNNQKGAVWIYTFNGSSFIQIDKITASGNIGSAHAGRAVSLSQDGKTVAFGGETDDSNAIGGSNGAAWVYKFDGEQFVMAGSKIVGDTHTLAKQGISVSISEEGETLVVGGYQDDYYISGSAKGAAWVYTFNGIGFNQSSAKLVGTGSKDQSSQGISVGISGDGKTIFSGAYGDDLQNGATWIFRNVNLPCYPPTILGYSQGLTSCGGDPVSLATYAHGTGLLEYHWYLNGTDAGITYATEFITIPIPPSTTIGLCEYKCVVSNTCGSATTPGINVTIVPRSTVTGNALPDPACEGNEVTITGFGAPAYKISGGVKEGVGFIPTVSGTYTLAGIGGCSDSTVIKLNLKKSPIVSLNLSALNNVCDSLNTIQLSGGNPPGGTYMFEGAATNDLNISKAGNYEIIYQYFDSNQCVNTISGILSAIVCTIPCDGPNPPCTCPGYTCPPPFKVYTAVTPNGDGLNDTWLIDSLPPENKVSIQDKWGMEVFKATNYNQYWDGKKENGHELPPGVYYYIVEFITDKRHFSGTISIIR